MEKLSLDKEKIKVLLLEDIEKSAEKIFRDNGYTNVECLSKALSPQELIEKLQDVFLLGIRSCTHLTQEIFESLPKLFAVGCYCIGTNQVALQRASLKGIPVFNAPHSNTRSVAELVIGLTIMLMRGIFEKNAAAHDGKWLKTVSGSHEVRGKIIGIIGYGHIGSQVSILAEALGMHVCYYDIQTKLPLGNAKEIATLDELLIRSDIVTLHVPDESGTKNLIGEPQLKLMKNSAFLINASRGAVVDIEALCSSLDNGKIAGAALDVFPSEPASGLDLFNSPLKGKRGVILTPHIGGATVEAQHNIAQEVTKKLINYSDTGSTEGAVNFPALHLPLHKNTHRILHIHKNVPGMLQKINKVIADENINIHSQYLLTNQDIGYVVLDIEKCISKNLYASLKGLTGTLRTRVIY